MKHIVEIFPLLLNVGKYWNNSLIQIKIGKTHKIPDNKKTSQHWLGGFQFKSWR